MALEPEAATAAGVEDENDEAAYYGDGPANPPTSTTESYLIDPSLPLSSVQITSLVLLKIIKHCQDYTDADIATGVLLGMDLEDKSKREVNLEVTNCFGLPKVSSESAEVDNYTYSMMKLFREVNVDNNNVGFFQSGNLSTSGNDVDLVKSLYSHQKDLNNNVVSIIYDPVRSRQGTLAIKAFRLSPEYMKVLDRGRKFREHVLPQSAAAAHFAATAKNVLQEIPIKIKDLSLSRALAWELQSQNLGACDRLELSINPYMRKGLEVLSATVEDTKADLLELSKHGRILMTKKQDRFKWIQERKHENSRLKKEGKRPLPDKDRSLPIFKPTVFRDMNGQDGRLKTHLSSNRVSATCNQINKFSGNTFNKLYLASGFHTK